MSFVKNNGCAFSCTLDKAWEGRFFYLEWSLGMIPFINRIDLGDSIART